MKILKISTEMSNHHAMTFALLNQQNPGCDNVINRQMAPAETGLEQGTGPMTSSLVARLPDCTTSGWETAPPPVTCIHSRMRANVLRIRTEVQSVRTCKSWCSCLCHASRRACLFYALQNVIGTLFVGYTGLPVLTPPCNEKTCRRSSIPSFHLAYFFPAWLLFRISKIHAAFDLMKGPQVSLSFPRVVPQYSPLWRFATTGDIPSIQRIFSLREASPLDVTVIGHTALHVSRFRHLTYCPE